MVMFQNSQLGFVTSSYLRELLYKMRKIKSCLAKKVREYFFGVNSRKVGNARMIYVWQL